MLESNTRPELTLGLRPPPAPPAPVASLEGAGPGALIDQLLRDRAAFVASLDRGSDLVLVAKTMIVASALGAAVFGASIGAYRGGPQLVFAALKLPLVVLFTAGLTAPALTGLSHAVGRRTSLRRDIVLILASLALGCLVIAALAPVVWLAGELGTSYHRMVLLVVGCCVAGGLGGLSLFARGLFLRAPEPDGEGPGRARVARSARGHAPWGAAALAGVLALVTMGLVGTQMSWSLRPYLVRPRTEQVPFLRAREGSFLDAVLRSSSSARGRYSRELAPLPGEQSDPEGAGGAPLEWEGARR